jgi:hypothetical protein
VGKVVSRQYEKEVRGQRSEVRGQRSEVRAYAFRIRKFQSSASGRMRGSVTRERGHRGVREESSSAGVPCLSAERRRRISTGSVSDLVGNTIALALNGACRLLPGSQASRGPRRSISAGVLPACTRARARERAHLPRPFHFTDST